MKVNLRKYYPEIYREDQYCDLPERVVEFMKEDARRIHAQNERIRRNKAYYSLDYSVGLEMDLMMQEPSVEMNYVEKERRDAIYRAISKLPKRQAQRIIAHYILGMSKTEIARIEGVSHSAIVQSIQKGIQKMKKFLMNANNFE